MRRRGLATTLVLVGLGRTLPRDQVPVSGAHTGAATTAGQAGREAAARPHNERDTTEIVGRHEPGLVYISPEPRRDVKVTLGASSFQ